MEISAGKLRGLRRLADKAGRFKMVAVDQRPPMIKSIGEKIAPRTAGYDEIAPVKALLARTLTPMGSAVLIDPDYGFSLAADGIPADRGLLITLEDFRFEDSPGGRMTRLPDGWDVGKIKRMGADGVKLLLWYRPDCSPEVVEHQKQLVRQVGEACTRYDIAFLLELLVYPFKGAANHTTDYTENKEKYPELVLQSLRDFADPSYGVDIYKLESPIPADTLPDPNEDSAETRKAQEWFDKIGTIIDRPWVMLSAGAGMEQFRRVLAFAYKAGANGYLAGRAIWWQAFGTYPDLSAMELGLERDSARYMEEINLLTDNLARPWRMAPALSNGVHLKNAGPAFPASYDDFSATAA
ncbi:tagatose 1,6-diphosphate aldolase [Microvirga pudoricolor]|uniref:tagatose 1,6-diphosphate aldolase n=1 Tax=Microvirga pudoricolor TaxID=2778729 RepID=UPI00194F6BB2|nr:tagatose 1,6-diphosphate aldolase [Microvirga pudoricolor]MBM6595108.1 tagatose 1,6-diphosphate aldolase [Microvirga pudoricolor]